MKKTLADLTAAQRWLGMLLVLLYLAALGGYVIYRVNQKLGPLEVQQRQAGAKPVSRWELYQQCDANRRCSDWLNKDLLPPELWLYGSGLVFIVLLSQILKRQEIMVSKKGTNRRANKADIQGLLERRRPEQLVNASLRRDNPLGGTLGFFEGDRKLWMRVPIQIDNVHWLVEGGTGGAKTTTVFRPKILLDAVEGNVSWILDSKWPMPNDSYVDTQDWFRAYGRKVTVFNPFSPDTHQLDLLSGISSFSDALTFTNYILPEDLVEPNDPIAVYFDNARLILAGLIYGLTLKQNTEVTFSAVTALIKRGGEYLWNWFEERPLVANEIKTAMDTEDKIWLGSVNYLDRTTKLFRRDTVSAMFSRGPNTVRLEELLLQPGMIHVVMPESEVRSESGKAILRLFKRYFDATTLKLVERLGHKLPYRVNLYYDELPLFGRIPNFADDLATYRSRNISVTMGYQNRKRLMDIYGKEGWEGIIENNIGVRVLLGGSFDQENAAYWSKLLGLAETLGVGEGLTTPTGFDLEGSSRKSKNYRAEASLIFTPDELMQIKLGWGLILVRHHFPILAEMPRVEDKHSPTYPHYEYAIAKRRELVQRNLRAVAEQVGEEHQARAQAEVQAQAVLPADPAPVVPPTNFVSPAPAAPSSSPQTRPQLTAVRVATPTKPSNVEVTRSFERLMGLVVAEKITVVGEGSPKRATRFDLTDAVQQLKPHHLEEMVEMGYLKHKGGKYFVTKDSSWGNASLRRWEEKAAVVYSAEAKPAESPKYVVGGPMRD